VVEANYIYDPGVTGILYQALSGQTKTDNVLINGNYIFYDSFSQNALPNNISCIDEVGGYNTVIENNVCVAPLTIEPATAGHVNAGITNGLGGSLGNGATSINTLIQNNSITGFADGILINDPGSNGDSIIGNTVTGSGGAGGIYIYATTNSTISNVTIEGNALVANGGAGLSTNSAFTGARYYRPNALRISILAAK
jgi:hypothetical protein